MCDNQPVSTHRNPLTLRVDSKCLLVLVFKSWSKEGFNAPRGSGRPKSPLLQSKASLKE